MNNCPSWFTEHLPSEMELDGELWMGRGTTHLNITPLLIEYQERRNMMTTGGSKLNTVSLIFPLVMVHMKKG